MEGGGGGGGGGVLGPETAVVKLLTSDSLGGGSGGCIRGDVTAAGTGGSA